MSGTLEKVWLVLAVLGGLFIVGLMILTAVGDEGLEWGFWTWAISLGGIAMLVGVVVRQRASRAAGDMLVVFGSLGLGLMIWLIVPTVVAIFLIFFGVKDVTAAKAVA